MINRATLKQTIFISVVAPRFETTTLQFSSEQNIKLAPQFKIGRLLVVK